MSRRAFIGALALVAVSVVLGATVFREDIALATQAVSAEIVDPLDSQGNVKVHEQGTADVRVTNRAVPVIVTDERVGVQQAGEPILVRLTGNQQYVVPADKRLLIQYVNGPAGLALQLLEPGGGINNDEFFLFPGNPVSQLVSITVRPSVPVLALGAFGDPGAVLSGYLIEP
jgi:hypothetical protein